MKMTSFRAKPIGWRGESHRHYLAAKGVKTRYYSVGPNIDASKDKQKYFAGSASYDETDGSLKSRLVKRRGRLEAELKKLDHDDIRGDKLINEILDIEHQERGLD
jgi:hypothetical protein